MIKSELARKLAERNPHLYLHSAERIVDVVFDEIVNALRDGSRVELRGFGAFSVKSREARKGRNPSTGSSVEIAAKRTPAFRCSKVLHQGLNKQED
jgi:integration host factor subunit beta